jgi:addiction module HigA family antidote
MTKAKEVRNTDFKVINSPGRLIKELMESRNVDAIDLSYELNLTQNEFNDLLNGDLPITFERATILGRMFNMPADIWLNVQEKYRSK